MTMKITRSMRGRIKVNSTRLCPRERRRGEIDWVEMETGVAFIVADLP
jgi:hypothetical protein